MLLHKDPLLRKVAWKDLAVLSLKDKLVENLVSLPWLVASLYFASQSVYWTAIPCSFMFFLTALRVVHNSFHKTLGLAKQANELTMYAYSLLMCVSIHAVCYNHLRHHSHCLQEEDVEGSCARMPAWKAFLYGPVFIFKIHTAAWKSNGINRKKMVLELLLVTTFLLVAFAGNIPFLQYHAMAMLVGELFSSFFAVWTVHHDCDEYVYARTQRGWLKNLVSYNMFYHLEHHLFPGVPTSKLGKLAKRIEKQCPHLVVKQVF